MTVFHLNGREITQEDGYKMSAALEDDETCDIVVSLPADVYHRIEANAGGESPAEFIAKIVCEKIEHDDER